MVFTRTTEEHGDHELPCRASFVKLDLLSADNLVSAE